MSGVIPWFESASEVQILSHTMRREEGAVLLAIGWGGSCCNDWASGQVSSLEIRSTIGISAVARFELAFFGSFARGRGAAFDGGSFALLIRVGFHATSVAGEFQIAACPILPAAAWFALKFLCEV